MKNTKTILLTSALFIASLTSFAQELKPKTTPVRLLITSALEFGGDEVAEIYFTNGNSQPVKAGQGGSLGVGAQFQVPSVEQFALRATVGIKYVTTAADNAHIRLTRVPLIFTANYMPLKKLRFGAGVAMHRSIRFKADGIGPDLTFESASGPTFEVAYAGIGLSYTGMSYKDNQKNTYSANAIGLTFSITVPNR